MALLAGIVAACLARAVAAAEEPRTAPEHIEFFERRIRPVLSARCYECHSEAAEKSGRMKGGLKLDSAAASRQGGESGPAVVPGDVSKSLLVAALKHESFEMPPDGKLGADVIDDFTRWIEIGAPDPRETAAAAAAREIDFAAARVAHWAFQPPRAAPPPAVHDAAWPLGDIDRFLLATLEAQGLRPAEAAPPHTWLRRACLTLTGLPPTATEIAALEADDSPARRAAIVDRLLADTAHAERWTRHWLDVARYSDDQALAVPRVNEHAHRYRDWVIRALADDMPYDRFLVMQLAGDLVDEPDDDSLRRYAGLGFQGLGQLYHRGNFPEQVMADELDDRVDVVSRGLLGLTVACARCHDHKYDPIPTRDYYSLAAAYFGADLYERPTAADNVIAAHGRFTREEKRLAAAIADWIADRKEDIVRRAIDELQNQLEAAWLIHARRVHGLPVDIAAVAVERRLPPVFLERWVGFLGGAEVADALVPLKGWHTAARADAASAEGGDAARENEIPESVTLAAAEVVQAAAGLAGELARLRAEREKAIAAAPADADRHAIPRKDPAGDFARWAAALQRQPAAPLFITDEALAGLLADADRATHGRLEAELAAFRKTAPPAPPLTHSIRGGGRAMAVHVRGSVDRKGEVAPPGFLRVLRPEPSSAAVEQPAPGAFTRLDLARAIASRENPLTARVIVNRVWHHHFGRGLVATPSNFGTLGDPPSHPELLDFLAVGFMDHGWSLRWLHRQIVLSRVYGIAATGSPDAVARDPENRLLWKWSARRLDFEAWRDSILAVSGLLDRSTGGPPAAVDEHVRRTIYSRISRSKLDPTLATFDFPDANVSSEKRPLTTVAQQQLYGLNSPFIAKAAQALAARIEAAADDDEARVDAAYRLAYGRRPDDAEREFVLAYLRSAPTDPADRLTPWQRVAQALLVANEFAWLP